MSVTYSHTRISAVDENNNVEVFYPENTGSDVKISRNNNSNIPSSVTNAQELANALSSQAFTNINIDTELSSTSINPVQNKVITSEARLKTWIGTCATTASTQDKVATVDSGFTLTKGVRIGIKFTHTNTYSSTTSAPITLNVNSTGAKNIWYNNTHSGEGNTGTNTIAYGVASRYVYYVYDGTYWVWDGCGVDNNTTYSAMSASELTTGTATTSRVVRADYLKSGIETIIKNKTDAALSETSTNPVQNKVITSSLQTLTNEVNGKVSTSNIANNLTTTASGKVLDARQGKVLNSAIQTLTNFVGKKLTAQTLAVGSTTLTFTDSSITTSSTIEAYASIYGVSPTMIEVTTGRAVVTFNEQDEALSVFLIIR